MSPADTFNCTSEFQRAMPTCASISSSYPFEKAKLISQGSSDHGKMEKQKQTESLVNELLFVYGTLRKGFRAHDIMRRFHARFVANGQAQGRLYDLGDYPGARESSRSVERVQGDVYLLPKPALAFRVLDAFEGYRPANPSLSLYERKRTMVMVAGRGQIEAWIYWLCDARAKGRRIPSGDFSRGRG